MSAWRTLVVENPMLIEVHRFRRKFLDSGRGTAINRLVIAVAAIAYIGLLLIVFNFSGDLPPVILVQLQTGMFALLAPAMLHGSIAGERDRRSWDLLLVSPISHRQIVVGKFMAALSGLLFGWLLFLFPTAVCALTYDSLGAGDDNYGKALVFQEIVSITFGVFACALALFISARCRRALAALGSGLAILFVALVLFPSLGGLLDASDQSVGALAFYFNPHWAIDRMQKSGESYIQAPDALLGIPQSLTYLGCAALLIVWAFKTLTYADGERKFISESRHA